MKRILYFFLAVALGGMMLVNEVHGAGDARPIVFGTFAENERQIENITIMIESLRAFGGQLSEMPVWVFAPAEFKGIGGEVAERLTTLRAVIKRSETPDETALWFYYARKVFAAGKAEADVEALAPAGAKSEAPLLAWLDDDTILLGEPTEFLLPATKSLGYRPVMHRNIGSPWSEPLDSFWSRAYALMAVREESLFPMVTIADGDTLRPYFNAGCLVVRPERGTLRRWTEYFKKLYRDETLVQICREDVKHRIFIHQASLTGAILNHLERGQLQEFSERINYPIFFEQMFGARRKFDDITDVVTFRHESYFRDPAPDWEED